MQGKVQVTGGSVEQAINHISIDVCCNYFSEETYTETDDDGDESEHTRIVRHTAKLASYKVADAFNTEAGVAVKALILVLNCHFIAPLSMGASKVWLETDLDIASAIDKSDKDIVRSTRNTKRQQQLLNAMNELRLSR